MEKDKFLITNGEDDSIIYLNNVEEFKDSNHYKKGWRIVEKYKK